MGDGVSLPMSCSAGAVGVGWQVELIGSCGSGNPRGQQGEAYLKQGHWRENKEVAQSHGGCVPSAELLVSLHFSLHQQR